MNQYGVCVMDDFLGHDRGLQILDEVEQMHSTGLFKVRMCFKCKDKETSVLQMLIQVPDS